MLEDPGTFIPSCVSRPASLFLVSYIPAGCENRETAYVLGDAGWDEGDGIFQHTYSGVNGVNGMHTYNYEYTISQIHSNVKHVEHRRTKKRAMTECKMPHQNINFT